MPTATVTTTARDVYFGTSDLSALTFRNGSLSGVLYLRNKKSSGTTVSLSEYDHSLRPGDALGFTKAVDGDGIAGPWEAIADAGSITLEILLVYDGDRRRR